MSNSDGDICKAIVHYQECLEKYARRDDEAKMLYCITKLYKLPVTIDHLTTTGVGRTVNSLRKLGGDVGERSRALVCKWKEMVAREEDAEETEQNEEQLNSENKTDDAEEAEEEEEVTNSFEEIKSQSASSSRESERKSRHDSLQRPSKDKNDAKHKDTHKHTDRDTNKHKNKKEIDVANRENKHKHKSSKRKHENDDYSENHTKLSKKSNDSEDDKIKRKQHENDKHKVSKHKHSELENNHKHRTKIDKKHHESYKKKYDSDVEDEQDDYEDEEMPEDTSDESQIEEKEVRKHSNKSHSAHKEEKHKSKDKNKKDRNLDSKSSNNKDRTKHSSEDKTKLNKNSSKSKHNTSKAKDQSSKKHSSQSTKHKVPVIREGIGSGSGTSFAEALGMLEPSSSKVNKKKIAVIPPLLTNNNDSSDLSSSEEFREVQNLNENILLNKPPEPLNINIASLLPEITPNYKPMGYSILDVGLGRNKINNEDETLSAIMYNKISRTKVYSGNKVAWGKVSSLFDLCTRVLQDNIDALEFTGGVPYCILKPVLERANYNQLFMLEQYNPYLMEDTDELWKIHCQRDFRNRSREEMETWRDMYQRCLDEREVKLRALTANIKQSQDKSLPVRQTKLAYVDSVVKPPRNIARKQAKHGTGSDSLSSAKKPAITPTSRLATLATAGAAGEISVPNPGSRATSSTSGSSNVVIKPKKAPLMQKTLALMKNRFRR